MYSFAQKFDLNKGVHIAYLSFPKEIIQLPIPQRMYQRRSYQEYIKKTLPTC